MPRQKKIEYDEQVYKIGNGATVTIRYDIERRPKFFQPADGVVIVGEHYCTPQPFAGLPEALQPRGGEESGLSRAEIVAWQESRERSAAEKKKPFTSEDAARQAGFPLAVVDFDQLSQVAAGMPLSEESIVGD